ncbi:MAG: cache domain-containing protein [Candidatus Hydrogenedentes bacterium]|nr:cache domain-containing protein [Candidatus Hydrogenedentota bacterium]
MQNRGWRMAAVCGAALLLSVALASCGGPLKAYRTVRQVRRVQKRIQKVLDSMDFDLAKAADALGRMHVENPEAGLDSAEARAILTDLYRKHPYVVDVSTVDAGGVMMAVEPAEYREAEGADISGQEQVMRLHAQGVPVLSNVFPAVEGFQAADLEYPVKGADGALVGSVSMLFRPGRLMGDIIEPTLKGSAWEGWVMQPDGRILYDRDPLEIGRDLFGDPLYRVFRDLLDVAKEIADEQSGTATYRFLGPGGAAPSAGKKECHWETVGIHGTEWRLVLTRDAE